MAEFRKFKGFNDFIANADYMDIFNIHRSVYKYLGYVQCHGFFCVNAIKLNSDGTTKIVVFDSRLFVNKEIVAYR